MSRSIVTDFSRPRQPEEQDGTVASRIKSAASRFGRLVATGGLGLIFTPTARTAHSQFGNDIRQILGASVPRPDSNPISTDAIDKQGIVREVVAEMDNEYPPMDNSFNVVTARQAASLAIDKVLVRLEGEQSDMRGEA